MDANVDKKVCELKVEKAIFRLLSSVLMQLSEDVLWYNYLIDSRNERTLLHMTGVPVPHHNLLGLALRIRGYPVYPRAHDPFVRVMIDMAVSSSNSTLADLNTIDSGLHGYVSVYTPNILLYSSKTGWWLSHPFEKYESNWIMKPQFSRWKFQKYLSCHNLENKV